MQQLTKTQSYRLVGAYATTFLSSIVLIICMITFPSSFGFWGVLLTLAVLCGLWLGCVVTDCTCSPHDDWKEKPKEHIPQNKALKGVTWDEIATVDAVEGSLVDIMVKDYQDKKVNEVRTNCNIYPLTCVVDPSGFSHFQTPNSYESLFMQAEMERLALNRRIQQNGVYQETEDSFEAMRLDHLDDYKS